METPLNIVCAHCQAINQVPENRLGDQPKCGQCKEMLFLAHPIELTDENFQKHLEHTDIPIVVDFWASWCGPCRRMAPVFEQAAAQLEPHIRLAKLNTEDGRETANRFGILSIPTLIIFKGGKEITRESGAMDLGSLVSWIKTHIR